MYNDLFSIGGLTIHGYGLMIAIGFIAAYLLAEKRAPKFGLDPEHLSSFLILALVFGLLGAKILYYITILPEILATPRLLLDASDGFVVYGGIIGGILSCMIYCFIKKLDFLKYFDLIMPSVAFAQGFGRIGCFLAGCCYGLETSCPLAITFTNSAFAPNNIPLLPTQLISSALNFCNCLLLCILAKKQLKKGTIASLYMITYSVGRFVIEFFRGDLIRGAVGPLSTSQFISLFVAAAGIVLLCLVNKKQA